ncbi:MAG: hypothetical protein ACUVQG_06055 [Thermogutta sp.]
MSGHKKIAIVMMSGGLDSSLAARILQLHGFEVIGFNVRFPFHRKVPMVLRAARDLEISLVLREVGEDFLQILRYPKHGYGRGANPCIDCRAYMLRMAGDLLRELGAMLVATGEVVGQRPMSQKRRDLGIIAHEAGLQGLILRPLSAKHLPPTIPEQEGWVDRDRLYDFSGRSRKNIKALARQLGLRHTPDATGGCKLTEIHFAPKVFDLLDHHHDATLWDCELLALGRHFRLNEQTKLVVGRDEQQNAALRRSYNRRTRNDCVFLSPANFLGPHAILIGPADFPVLMQAAQIIIQYVHRPLPDMVEFEIRGPTETRIFSCKKETLAGGPPHPTG